MESSRSFRGNENITIFLGEGQQEFGYPDDLKTWEVSITPLDGIARRFNALTPDLVSRNKTRRITGNIGMSYDSSWTTREDVRNHGLVLIQLNFIGECGKLEILTLYVESCVLSMLREIFTS